MVDVCFNVLRNCQAVFQRVYTILHFYQQCMSFICFSPSPALEIVHFFHFSQSNRYVVICHYCLTCIFLVTNVEYPFTQLICHPYNLLWWSVFFVLFLFFFFFFFCLFLLFLAPTAFGGSQARGWIGAVTTSLHHSHSNAGSELRLRPTPQLTATPDP